MRVIGAGFGRTGTFSLKTALNRLGFGPTYHMTEVFEHPEDAATWLAAARGEPVKWQAFLRNYNATVDWPGAHFYKELMAAFPAASVVLTVRDEDAWYESASRTIAAGLSRSESGALPDVVQDMIRAVVWDGTFGGDFENRDHAIAIYREHNRQVQEAVPADKLLVYSVDQGWEPLCRFLEVEVPDEPFPHLNTTQEWEARSGPPEAHS